MAAIFLSSCGRDFKINEEHFDIVPYDGSEILVFESNTQDRDTIFLVGLENRSVTFGPMEILPDNHEVYRIKTKLTDPNYDRYLNGKSLIELIAVEGTTLVSFDIAMKRSWFYDLDTYSVEQLDSIPNSDLIIGTRTYSDVKIFNATEYAKQFSERDNYAKRFYWSLSEGFLGLDRSDEQWRLVKKYKH